MNKILLTFLNLCIFSSISYGQSCPADSEQIGIEEFESTANLTADPGSGFFNDGSSDHFNVTDGTDISGTTSGFTGSFFAAEDVNDDGGTGANPQVFTITFDVTNFMNLSFTGLFAQPETGGFDDSDDVTVSASIDGGTPEIIIDVDEIDDGDAFNQLAQIDGIQLTNAAQEFSSPISGTGTTLTLTISVSLGAASETIAFDNFTICGIPVVTVPVELTHFSTTQKDGMVALEWTTASEINSDLFIIEHSIDGNNYQDIMQVKSAGNSAVKQSYNFLHRNPANGLNYYRLKQIDLSGAYNYSNVRIEKYSTNNLYKVYPSHASNSINIDLSEPTLEKTNIYIYDFMGRMLMSEEISKESRQSELNISNLESGQYIIHLVSGGHRFTSQFAKIN